jgi:predicted enzyme related to lactoylglutathione lyase
LKQIDQVGTPPTEIIMRYGATAAAAKAGTSPEFLIEQREGVAADGQMAHAIFQVSDVAGTVAAAKGAGASVRGEIASVPIGNIQVKIATVVDPDGNVLELMELPKGVDHLPHP